MSLCAGNSCCSSFFTTTHISDHHTTWTGILFFFTSCPVKSMFQNVLLLPFIRSPHVTSVKQWNSYFHWSLDPFLHYYHVRCTCMKYHSNFNQAAGGLRRKDCLKTNQRRRARGRDQWDRWSTLERGDRWSEWMCLGGGHLATVLVAPPCITSLEKLYK